MMLCAKAIRLLFSIETYVVRHDTQEIIALAHCMHVRDFSFSFHHAVSRGVSVSGCCDAALLMSGGVFAFMHNIWKLLNKLLITQALRCNRNLKWQWMPVHRYIFRGATKLFRHKHIRIVSSHTRKVRVHVV